MRKIRYLPISKVSRILLMMPLIALVVLAACRDGRAPSRTDVSTVPPEARESTMETVPDTPSFSGEERDMGVNRIAYVGAEGNIFTIRPDGTDSRRLTSTDLRVGPAGPGMAQVTSSEVVYTWPTWSPESDRLAASRIIVDGNSALFSLEVLDASTGRATLIYDNEPGTLPIAQGSPHYIYWSPDGKHLTFIASTPGELALFITTPGEGVAPTRLAGQGPLYFSWADNSSAFLVHRGTDLLLTTLSPSGDHLQGPQPVGLGSLGFRAPVLSRDGSKMAYVAEEDGEQFLSVSDAQPQLPNAERLLKVGSVSAFLRSPTRDEVAVADATTGPLYERVSLVALDGTAARALVTEPLLAFFWSPDGEKIAYFNYDPAARSFTLKYVDRTEGTPVTLAEFLPSPEFLTMITFFDQYAYSNSIWSPDSTKIVFSGAIGPGAPRRNGSTPDGNKAYVVDVREGSLTREIATSRFAVWSWK